MPLCSLCQPGCFSLSLRMQLVLQEVCCMSVRESGHLGLPVSDKLRMWHWRPMSFEAITVCKHCIVKLKLSRRAIVITGETQVICSVRIVRIHGERTGSLATRHDLLFLSFWSFCQNMVYISRAGVGENLSNPVALSTPANRRRSRNPL